MSQKEHGGQCDWRRIGEGKRGVSSDRGQMVTGAGTLARSVDSRVRWEPLGISRRE